MNPKIFLWNSFPRYTFFYFSIFIYLHFFTFSPLLFASDKEYRYLEYSPRNESLRERGDGLDAPFPGGVGGLIVVPKFSTGKKITTESLTVDVKNVERKRVIKQGYVSQYPDMGQKFLLVKAEVENFSTQPHFADPKHFSLIDSAGDAHLYDDAIYMLDERFEPTYLNHGQTIVGWLVFQIDADFDPVQLLYAGVTVETVVVHL